MLSVPWIFAGAITGFLIVSVFNPPIRKVLSVPTPDDTGPFHTKTGCINIQASEVECSGDAISLNILK